MLRYFREFLVCGFEGTWREVIFGLSLFFYVDIWYNLNMYVGGVCNGYKYFVGKRN